MSQRVLPIKRLSVHTAIFRQLHTLYICVSCVLFQNGRGDGAPWVGWHATSLQTNLNHSVLQPLLVPVEPWALHCRVRHYQHFCPIT